MSGEHWLTALVAALTTLLSVGGVFMVKSRLGEVMASPSVREETAVQKMAELVDKLANFQAEREARLFDLQDKAMETVGLMVLAVKEVTILVQTHDAGTIRSVGALSDGQSQILTAMQRVVGQLEGIGGLVSDLALEVIQGRRKLQEGNPRDAKD